MSGTKDILGVIRGVQAVVKEAVNLGRSELNTVLNNSSLRKVPNEISQSASKVVLNSSSDPFALAKNVRDTGERVSLVLHSAKEVLFYNLRTPIQAALKAENSLKSHGQHNVELSEPVNKTKHCVKHLDTEIKLTARDKELLKKLDMEHREKLKKEGKSVIEENHTLKKDEKKDKSKKNKQSLSASAKQRTVPSSRIGRMVSFGSLAAGLGVGTAKEYLKRSFGLSDGPKDASVFMNPANMDRIVDTLCKVRGAALKIGQMLSIQDESLVNPELSKALERVRKSADFMPDWQVERVMSKELGAEWREKFLEFETKPFAAASIGQVHWGRTKDGRDVAIKIQYPGVAKGIESDIDNLVGIMKVWDLFPKGMFIDNLVVVSKRELAWEVDYIREATCTRRFRELLRDFPEYYVPQVFGELCTKEVFTTEFVEGVPIDECAKMSMEHRKYVASKIMELCLREMLEFRFMQTDPNWANFFYDVNTKKIILLDFGASREYTKKFMDGYVKIMRAAADNDQDSVLSHSKQMGFLTGYESKLMETAHVEAVMIFGEIFRCPGEFDFSNQDTLLRIQNLIPTMLAHRLCPPPDEIYSLHRKLVGVFLLCAKLKTAIAVRPLFEALYNKYEFDVCS